MLAVGMLLVLSISLNVQSLISWMLQTYTGERLVIDFRSHPFWHAPRMSLLCHDKRGTNDVAYRIQHDAPSIQYIFLQGMVPVVSAALSFLAMLYVTSRMDWVLSAVALCLSPILFYLARKSSRETWRMTSGRRYFSGEAIFLVFPRAAHEVAPSEPASTNTRTPIAVRAAHNRHTPALLGAGAVLPPSSSCSRRR